MGITEKVLSRRQSEILPTGEAALVYNWVRTRPVSIKVSDRMLELSRLCSLLRGTAPCRTSPQYTAPLASTAPLPYAAPYVTMPAMSARPALSMGYYGQGSQFPFVPNPN